MDECVEIIENNMSENKITNCSRCGTNPWKQGCYALWGKSPKDLLHNKEKDSGYICSICAYKAFRDPRFVDCPIYGIYAKEKSEHDKIDYDKVYKMVEAIFGKE